MNSKEDERVAHCSVEEWEAGSIRVPRVVVEIDAYLAGSYLATNPRDTAPMNRKMPWYCLMPLVAWPIPYAINGPMMLVTLTESSLDIPDRTYGGYLWGSGGCFPPEPAWCRAKDSRRRNPGCGTNGSQPCLGVEGHSHHDSPDETSAMACVARTGLDFSCQGDRPLGLVRRRSGAKRGEAESREDECMTRRTRSKTVPLQTLTKPPRAEKAVTSGPTPGFH
jgi:hypothetical protein